MAFNKGYNYDPNGKTFVNPYNFVRTKRNNAEREAIGENESGTESDRLTGKLKCRIYLKTPLAIPDIESVTYDEKKHPTYSFFRMGDTYTIPGSTLRGSIRSVYETLTESCYVTMIDDELISNREVPETDIHSGLLKYENGQWNLYEAERIRIPKEDTKFSESILPSGERAIKYGGKYFLMGDRVKAACTSKYNPRSRKDELYATSLETAGQEEWYLYVGEPFGKKQYESIFKQTGNRPVNRKKLDSALTAFKYSLEMYRNPSINRNLASSNGEKTTNKHHGYIGYDRCMQEQKCVPVWYRNVNNNISLYAAAIGRNVYEKSVNVLLGKFYEPCTKRDCACPACQLFGMAKGESQGSKIRFSDAFATRYDEPQKKVLQELGSPRPGYYPFYSVDGLKFSDRDAEINGRKYYWHNKAAATDSSVYETKEKTERNATMELLKNSEFIFDVFFDGITQKELDAMKAVLTLGENDKNSELCHKLGHGKPLGLGSAKIVIEEETLRTFSCDAGYQPKKMENVQVDKLEEVFASDAVKEVKTICSFSIWEGQDVCYPYIDVPNELKNVVKKNDTANHQWFKEMKGKVQLHQLTDDRNAHLLDVLEIGNGDNKAQNNNRNTRQNGRGDNRRTDNYRSSNRTSYQDKDDFKGNNFFNIIIGSDNETGSKKNDKQKPQFNKKKRK